MQGAADTAASAAATSLAAGTTNPAVLASEAKSIAAYYNFVGGSNGTTVTVNYPPKSGTHQTNAAVEVEISKQETPLLSSLFLRQGPTISVRAVALVNSSLTGEACVVALDKNNETSMTTSGSVGMEFPGCSLYINSPNSYALNMNGGATIHPNIAYIVGGYSGGGLTTENGTYLGVDPLLDPYRTVTVPAYSGCNSNNYKMVAGKTDTKNVGSSGVYVFCKGLELEGNSSLTLGPGTFIITGTPHNQAQLKIASNATLNATSGTTIILTSTDQTSICDTMATANIAGGAKINIVAPTTGSLAGVALYQDRTCKNHTLSNQVAGGTTQSIKGAIYFPEQPVDFAGGSATGGAQCTHLVAWTIRFVGNSTFKNNCADAGTRKLSLTGGRLVE